MSTSTCIPDPQVQVHTSTKYYISAIFAQIFLVGSVFFYFCKSDVSAVQGHPRSLILVPIESAWARRRIRLPVSPS